MTMKMGSVIGAAVALTLAGAAGRLADVRIEGKFATNDVLVKGGKTYVPLADVAKALGLSVQKRPADTTS